MDTDKVSGEIIPAQHPNLNRSGRPKGTPNKATAEAREAIALFVNNNAHRLEKWLNDVADGGKYIDETGKQVFVPPNPVKAFELFMRVIEFHIPKLQRSEIESTVRNEYSGEVNITHESMEEAAAYYKTLCEK